MENTPVDSIGFPPHLNWSAKADTRFVEAVERRVPRHGELVLAAVRKEGEVLGDLGRLVASETEGLHDALGLLGCRLRKRAHTSTQTISSTSYRW